MQKASNITFGLAIEALESGKCVSREEWKTPDKPIQYSRVLCIRPGITVKLNDTEIKVGNLICLSVDNAWVHDGWLPTTEDIFAKDWYIIE